MAHRGSDRRPVRIAITVLVGVAVGVAGYLALQRLSAPSPRPSPGWTLLAEMPNPRGETASAVAGDLVVVAGGFIGLGFETTAIVSFYDARSGTWADGPALPAARNHAAAAGLDGTVYVSGGAAPSGGATDTLWALTPGAPGATSWTELQPMPGPRSAHRLVALDGRLYAVGGVGGPAEGAGAAGRLLVYDVAAGAWAEGAEIPLNRDHVGAVAVNGEIWAIGGRAGAGNHTRVDIYDPATDSWRDGPAIPAGTSGAAEAILDGVIYLSGGEDPATGTIVDRHWRLDTALGDSATWDPLAPPPLAVHGVPGIAVNGRFLVIAGSTRPGGQSNTAWTGATQAFDPAATD